ncbi:MAG: hypothetical protein DVB28_000363 [Verrucomicrobia bacterium]|nr:MAG: hypothetical protein DVB28_000363 [Verrucomicrobiota bacterium]
MEKLWEKDALWEFSRESFEDRARGLGFEWTSQQKESARSAGADLTLGGIPLAEAVARFSTDKISGLVLQFYTRGDSGSLARADYEDLLRRTIDLVNSLSQAKPQSLGKDPASSVRAEGMLWKSQRTTWRLEYSMSREITPQGLKMRPEFLRLELSPVLSKGEPVRGTAARALLNPRAGIKNLPNGDVLIEGIPMVDQGQKGYCFPASAERILRSYGMRADQNELAQLSGAKGGGSSLSGGIEGLKTAGLRLQFRVKMVDQPEIRELETLVREYNRRVLKYGQKAQVGPLSGGVDLEDLLSGMRPEVLRAARMGMKVEKSRFFRSIQTSIDGGHPLIWGVLLGLVEEPEIPQASGWHARLLVGYNSKTSECLYSDSWGAGHELKRMALDDAWMMHQFTMALIPTGSDSAASGREKGR